MGRPMDQGDLGIKNVETKNKCSLKKWMFKFLNKEGVWQVLLPNKYIYSKTHIERSHFPFHISSISSVDSTSSTLPRAYLRVEALTNSPLPSTSPPI